MFYKSKYFKSVIMIMVVTLLATGCGLKQGSVAAVRELEAPITLRYWRVFDGSDAFREIIDGYKIEHPNVNIEYRKFRYDEYEQALLEAWAEDRGPDIFTIHNTWVGKYMSKIEPLPESYKLPYVVKRHPKTGAVEKAEYREMKSITIPEVRNNFTESVYKDVARGGKIYGLPLSVDSLALIYNRTMLDNAGITKVPSTWLEIKEAVKKLTLQDDEGNIVQAGIALGGTKNINRASDILQLLMMQNGTEMVNPTGRKIMFGEASPYADDKNYKPGMEALRFYTDFAMPSKEVYSWNSEMPEASEAFVTGKLAMLLGYSYQLPFIRTQGARLNIGVAGVPHINLDGTDALGTQVNMASYWVETVAKKTEHINYAWDFLQYATRAEQANKYLVKTQKPTALRSLIAGQINDPLVGVFAKQVLTARSWYRGKNPLAVEEIFDSMIDRVVEGKNTTEEAIGFAAQRVGQTL